MEDETTVPDDLKGDRALRITIPPSRGRSESGNQPPAPAVSIMDAYEVLGHAGTGGMGRVVKARHKELGRTVAIKTLRPELGGDPRFIERFKTEARALAAIKHSNIVTIHDFGPAADGGMCLVMEFVDGSSLRDRLRKGPLPLADALKLLKEVCSGIAKAHDLGIVHRDLKPENILIGSDGVAKVADFGLAKTVSWPTGHAGGESDDAIGTVKYLAPEQKPPLGDITVRTDVFVLGLLIYEVLAGSIPEGAFEPLSSLAGTPKTLDEVVRKCLQPDSQKRYASAGHLLAALDQVFKVAEHGRGSRRTMLIASAAAAGAGFAGFGLGWMIWRKIDLLEAKIQVLNANTSTSVESGRLASIQSKPDGKAELQLTPQPGGKAFPIGALRIRCDSTHALKAFSVVITDTEGRERRYEHKKLPVAQGIWDKTVPGGDFVPPLETDEPFTVKDVVIIIEPGAGPDESSEMVMKMSELALVP